MSANALMIVKLEDTLLHELSASEGNILDNSDLIETLNQTKETSTAIKAKVEQAEFTKAEISKARLGYTPVAKRGSILYFVMASLSTISSMYETSLDSFLGVFNKALDHAKKDVVLDNRLRNMSESVMRDVDQITSELKSVKFIVFDDYGAEPEVRRAVAVLCRPGVKKSLPGVERVRRWKSNHQE